MKVFIGERGPLTTRGVRALTDKYAAISGVAFTPHVLRHTFAKRFLAETKDLPALACLLGHSSLNTTQIYVQRSAEQLAEAAERVTF